MEVMKRQKPSFSMIQGSSDNYFPMAIERIDALTSGSRLMNT
jgi:hypothetical protein